MTVTIPAELDDFVRAKLQAGDFENAEAVVAAALGAWQAQEVFHSLDQDEVEQQLLAAIHTPRIPWNDVNLDEILSSLRKTDQAL